MAFEPNEWKKGDVVTAAKLNGIEAQIVANEAAIAELTAAVEALTPASPGNEET